MTNGLIQHITVEEYTSIQGDNKLLRCVATPAYHCAIFLLKGITFLTLCLLSLPESVYSLRKEFAPTKTFFL